MKKNLARGVISSVVLGTLLIAGTAFADTSTTMTGGMRGSMGGHMPGVVGTVSAINGTTLTVASKGFGSNATATTYTVNASAATVTKSNADSAVSNIAVGDTVMIQGTVSGTSVTAISIRDGVMGPMGGRGMGGMHNDMDGMKGGAASGGASIIQGNGQPVIGGSVTAINGTTLTVTNKSNVTYIVDTTSAFIAKDNATSSLSAISVGDNVVVQGSVNGTAVTATSLMNQGAAVATNPSSTGNRTGPRGGFMGGIFAPITSIFHRLFGFF